MSWSSPGPDWVTKKKPKKEKAGPYRSQSSNPKIRSEATKSEHGKVTVTRPSSSSSSSSSSSPSPSEVFDTGIKPESTAEQRRRQRARKAVRVLRKADLPGGLNEQTPQYHLEKARTEGKFPPVKLKQTAPKVYKQAEDEAHAFLAERENLKEDPLAEFLIDTAATAGVGAGASALGKLGAKGLAAAGAKLASTEATAGESLAEKGIKAVAKSVKGSPKRAAVKVKAIKANPRAAAGAEAKRIGQSGRRVKAKPVRYTVGGQAAAVPLGIDTPGTERGRALVEGTGRAVVDNPLGTAEATGRGLWGAVTGPVALGAAGIDSLRKGTTEPLERTAAEQVAGLGELGEDLLSGDPKRVQETVERDVGLSYALPGLAVTKTKGWKAGRSGVRRTAAAGRRGVAKATGSKRIRVVPKEAAAESYVFGPLERRAARRRVAEQVTAATNPERSKAAYHQKQILNALKKAPVTRSLRNRTGMEAGDLLQTLAEYGIRTPEDVRLVRERGPVGDVPEAGKVTLRSALDFADAHPEILSDKHFRKALDAYIESSKQLPAAKANKGRRAAIMAQGDLFGITRPEERVPMAARPYTQAKTRAEAWADVDRRKKSIAKDRKRGRDLAAQAQVATGPERAKLRDESALFYRAAKDAESLNYKLTRALRGFKRPEHALKASARRKPYDASLLREYEAEVARARERAGLAEPAWTHHQEFREPGEIGPAYPTAAGRVEHMRSGSLAADDLVDRSLRALISGSVVSPRLRAGGQRLAREFTEGEMLPIKVDGETKHLVTSKEFSDALRDGQYDPRSVVIFPARQFKQAVLDPYMTQAEKAGVAGQALEAGLRGDTKGNKYVVVKREAAKEFQAQIDPRKWAGEAFVNAASKGVSRWLLFSPAWAAIQSVAEAVPMVMAHPELLSPAKLAKLGRAVRRNTNLRPDEAKAFAATVGEAPTSLHTPDELRASLGSDPHGVFSDGARALTKSKLGQGFFSLIRLRPFGEFDNWRQGKYREILAAAKVDRELNSWYGSLKAVLGIERRISEELRGLPLDEQMAALTQPKYRKDLDAIKKHVENISGNWQSFTRYERVFAPFLVFYPFIRYSLRWPLVFAKHHPVAMEVAVMLGQQNAEQLEKILGHAPSNPLAYAIPVWQSTVDQSRYDELIAKGYSEDEAEYLASSHLLEAGQRMAPGLSAPTQALASQQPSQLLSTVNPLAGAGLTGLTGINAYTGEQEAERGWQAADLLTQLSPIARYFGLDAKDVLNAVPGVNIESEGPSPATKRFEEIDPRKRDRSLIEPWADLNAQQFKAKEEFRGALDRKYSDPIPNVWDNPEIYPAIQQLLEGKPAAYKRLLKEHNAAEKAADRVTSQEQKFFEEQEELTPAEQDRFNKALEQLQGGIFIPTDEEEGKAKGGGPIGGHSLGGSIGGESSGSGGRIGGKPLGSIGGKPLAGAGKRPKVKVGGKVPKIEGVDLPGEATEFAQYLSKYTGLDPQFVGAWVKSEGGGFANGGEAGKNNWLGVGYPGQQTAFSQSPYFNGDAKTAAKATADWMLGKIGGEYDYAAAQGIKEIIPKAAGKGPDVALRALADSGWGTLVDHVAENLGTVSASGQTTIKPAKKHKGEWAGTKPILLQATKGIEISSTKRTPEHNAEIGGSPTSDHLTTNENTFATDLPTTDGVPIGEKVAKRLGVEGWTPGNYDWYTSPKHPGYRFQILWAVEGHYDHVHVGAEWTGEDLPAGTMLGGSYGGSEGGYSGGTPPSSSLSPSAAVSGAGKAKARVRRPETKLERYERINDKLDSLTFDRPEPTQSRYLEELRRKYKSPV